MAAAVYSQHPSNSGFTYSAILHALMIFFLIFGLPSFLRHKMDPEPQSISVDILPIAPISNVKPQEKPPEKVEKKPVAEEKTAKKEMAEAHKEQPKEEVEPEHVSAKQVVKKPEKKIDKKPVPKKDSLDDILKSVKDSAKAQESKKPTEKAVKNPAQNPAKSDNYVPTMPLSMSEKDAIKSQFIKCWNVPAGAKEAYNLAVLLHITLSADGTVTSVALASDQSRYGSDTFFRAAADSAIRAVKLCSPLKNLSPDKYAGWSAMELNFDPKDMLY